MPMVKLVELFRSRRSFVVGAGLALLASAAVATWIQLRIGGTRATLWVDDLATPVAAAVACMACVRARARHGRRMRLFWTLLGCATACWTLAEVIWGVYALILDQTVPSPSWADVGYLAAIPLTVAALVAHPGTRGSGTRKARSALDGMVLAAALLFLSWTLVLGPLWRSTDLSTWGGIVTIAYPFGDVVIVFFVVLAIRGMAGGDRLSLWCMLVALLTLALSDSTYTYLTEVANYSSSTGNVIDAGWVAAYLGIALAARTSRPQISAPATVTLSRPSLASLVSPLLPVLLALGVAAVQIKLGHHLDNTAWLIALGLIALVLARQALLVLELLGTGEGEAGLGRRLTATALGSVTAEERSHPGRPA